MVSLISPLPVTARASPKRTVSPGVFSAGVSLTGTVSERAAVELLKATRIFSSSESRRKTSEDSSEARFHRRPRARTGCSRRRRSKVWTWANNFCWSGLRPVRGEGVQRIAGPAAGEIAAIVRVVAAGHADFVAVVKLRDAAQRGGQSKGQLQFGQRASRCAGKTRDIMIGRKR